MRTYNLLLKRKGIICTDTVTTNPIGLILYRWKNRLWEVTVIE